MNLRFNKFYSPEDGVGTGTTEGESLDTFELLNADETPEPEKPLELPKEEEKEEIEEKEEKEEKEEEELELEEEEELPKDEELDELVTPVRRKEILAKYPNLFKEFPYLEKAYYREQQFTEVFPTIQDARLSREKAQILDRTEREVMNGDITNILRAAKSENQEAFHKIADNYLPTLKQVDQQVYYHVLGNVIKDTIITMVREGRNLGEQGAPLTAAANVLNQFIFGSQTFQPPTSLTKRVSQEEQQRDQQYQQQEHQRVMNQFTQVRDDLQTRADNVLRATIDGHIDPNKSMTSYVKQHAVAEAHDNLENLISKDTRFRALLDKLWQKSFQEGFSKESQDRIKAAYLSKAKTLLPSVIKKARNNALKDVNVNGNEEVPTRKSPITPGRSTSPSGTKYRKASDIPKGMSTLDVLMKD